MGTRRSDLIPVRTPTHADATEAVAAVFESPGGPLALRPFDLSKPRPGGFLARVVCCTVCGSDVHTWTGKRPGPAPGILGHEIAAVVERLGPGPAPTDVTGRPLAIGDRVVWAVVAACGTCDKCRRGVPQKCDRGWKYGHQGTSDTPPDGRASPLSGGLATHCEVVPGSAVVRVPDEVTDVLAATATCAGATAAAAVRTAGDLRDRRVLVGGAGMLGLFAAALAADAGAAEVVVVDAAAWRLELAGRVGATEVIAAADRTTLEAALAGRARGFDAFFECTGNPDVTELGTDALGLSGRAVLVGAVYPAPRVRLDAQTIVRRLLTIAGVHNYAPPDLVAAMSFLARRSADPALRALVGATVPLSDVADWQPMAERGEHLRVAVRPE